ncbi:MAG: GNAT family N-acetyltransferase [Clostridiales bacterium]|nr:GNAT family N-acetyltransferase [Clostridiales bacterium]
MRYNKVKSVFCFAVAPKMRKKGIAKALLAHACSDAKAEGFDFIEAYPNKAFVNTEDDFMGSVNMYEELGFTDCYETENKKSYEKEIIIIFSDFFNSLIA